MMINSKSKKLLAGAAWVSAIFWTVFLLTISLLPRTAIYKIIRAFTDGLIWLIYTIFDTALNSSIRLAVFNITYFGLYFISFGVLSLLIWNLLRIRGFKLKRAVILSFSATTLIAVLFELSHVFFPDYAVKVSHCLINIIGGASSLIAVILIYRFPRVFNRETISYVIFGGFTTIVNMVVYGLFFNTIGLHNLISNAIAWVASVLFAYVVNKIFVFRSRTNSVYQAAREFALFVGARLFSFGVDEAGMWILVDMLNLNGGLSKIAVNVIVLIMNYFFSKLIVFKKTDTEQPLKD
jgi:putative flippase GtrA/VanZ family protein